MDSLKEIGNEWRRSWFRISVTIVIEQKRHRLRSLSLSLSIYIYIYIYTLEIKGKKEYIMLPSRTLIKKKGSFNNIENPFLVSY